VQTELRKARKIIV